MSKRNKKRGFITIIIVVIAALIALKYYFNIDVRDLLKSKIILDIWNLLKELATLLFQLVVNILDFLKVVFDKIKGLFIK